MNSPLQNEPKSKVIETGYINIYTNLNSKERRQLGFKLRYKEENPSWDETTVYLSKTFSHLCDKGAVVLDAGCGNGNYIIDENRKKIGWAVGVDLSKEATSKNICLDEIRYSNLEKLPFENNKFDLAVSLWVLEHLKHPENMLKEVHRVLKPGGFFLFATPNLNYLPLKLVHTINLNTINYFLNKKLFGREEKGVFPTYYKINTIKRMEKAVFPLFKIEELRLNSDISYTSFNNITYELSNILLRLPKIFSSMSYPHIVGVLKKTV